MRSFAIAHPNACRCEECDCPVIGVPLGLTLCMSCGVDDHCAKLRYPNWRIDFDRLAHNTYPWIVQKQIMRNGPWHTYDSATSYVRASIIIATNTDIDHEPIILTESAQAAQRFGFES